MSRLTDMRRDGQPSFTPADETARWNDWRVQRLLAAGFSMPLAEELARDHRIDLHDVLELVDRGCRPDLAARIVAPLEPERKRP